MRQFLLATRNSHKTREFAQILGDEFAVRDLADVLEFPLVEETGGTFLENAILKAVAASRHFPGLIVADDSGLEVDALDGAPGIFSARYAGERASDQENTEKLLREMASRRSWRDFPSCDETKQQVGNLPHLPSARFRCVLALAEEGRILETFAGVIEGSIVPAPRGENGFGYDPVFVPAGFTITLAEMPAAQKNQISHRTQAIRALRAAILA